MPTRLAEQWQALSGALGIDVTAPFSLSDPAGGTVEFDALVHNFGSRKGMVLLHKWDKAKATLAVAQGYGYSCMSLEGHLSSESAKQVLRDWGWSGPQSLLPPWYPCFDPGVEK